MQMLKKWGNINTSELAKKNVYMWARNGREKQKECDEEE
jgi:hypothetical protein